VEEAGGFDNRDSREHGGRTRDVLTPGKGKLAALAPSARGPASGNCGGLWADIERTTMLNPIAAGSLTGVSQLRAAPSAYRRCPDNRHHVDLHDRVRVEITTVRRSVQDGWGFRGMGPMRVRRSRCAHSQHPFRVSGLLDSACDELYSQVLVGAVCVLWLWIRAAKSSCHNFVSHVTGADDFRGRAFGMGVRSGACSWMGPTNSAPKPGSRRILTDRTGRLSARDRPMRGTHPRSFSRTGFLRAWMLVRAWKTEPTGRHIAFRSAKTLMVAVGQVAFHVPGFLLLGQFLGWARDAQVASASKIMGPAGQFSSSSTGSNVILNRRFHIGLVHMVLGRPISPGGGRRCGPGCFHLMP